MEKLALKAGIEHIQVSDNEQGRINTTISTVREISEALAVLTNELFDFEMEHL